jgi:hypothetical protein
MQITSKPRGNMVLNIARAATSTYMYVNLVHLMTEYEAATTGGWYYESILNDDGYPQSSPTNAITARIPLFPTAEYSGDYIIDWVGQFGTGNKASGVHGVTLSPVSANAFTVVEGEDDYVRSKSNGLSLTGTNGRVRFTPNAGNAYLTFSFIAGGPISTITRMRLYRADREAYVLAGCIFEPEWLNTLKELNCSIVRGLDGFYINEDNTLTHFDQIPGTGKISFATRMFVPGQFVGTISSSGGAGVAYSCSAWSGAPSTPTHGTRFEGWLTDTNTTTSPTLAFGSWSAKPLLSMFGFTNVGSHAGARYHSAAYDSVLDSWLMMPGNTKGATSPLIPLAYQVQLCKELRADFWCNVPHLWEEESYELLAASLQTLMPSWMKVYLQFSNECGWNQGSGFPQSGWLNTKGNTMFPTGDANRGGFALKGYLSKRFYDAFRLSFPVGERSTRVKAVSDVNLLFLDQRAVEQHQFQGKLLTFDSGGAYTTGTGTFNVPGYFNSGAVTFTTAGSQEIRVGHVLNASGLTQCTITYDQTGDGGAGIYRISGAVQTVGSVGTPVTVTVSPGGSGNAIVTDYRGTSDRPAASMDRIAYGAYPRGEIFCSTNDSKYIVLRTPALTITGITQAAAAVITATNASTTLANGDRVYISTGITGMDKLENTYWTVYDLGVGGTDKFKISNGYLNGTGSTNAGSGTGGASFNATAVTADTSAETAWSAGGTVSKLNSDAYLPLIEAADDYVNGNAAAQAAALLWVDTDMRTGLRPTAAGGFEAGEQNLTIHLDDIDIIKTAATSYGLLTVAYESNMETYPPSGARLQYLGYSETERNNIITLLKAYKQSALCKQYMLDFFDGMATDDGIPCIFLSPYANDSSVNDTTLPPQWSIRDGNYFSQSQKITDAIIEYNNR